MNGLKKTIKHYDNRSKIHSSTWFSNFQNLNTLRDKFKEQYSIENKLFNELDMSINVTEISLVLTRLKSNISLGFDNISNDLFKHEPILRRLFNIILSSGLYQKS